MTDIRPTNLLRQLCAIEFRTDQHRNAIDLIGTINFNDTTVSYRAITARFGLLGCELQVRMSSGRMPLETQLAQKILNLYPVGDPLKNVTNTIDRERTGRLALGTKAYAANFDAEVSGKQKDSETVAGKSFRPEYQIHINLCGDHELPAWQFRSVQEVAPIVGILRSETFGRIVEFSEPVTIVVALKASAKHVNISLQGDRPRRLKALREILTKEFELLIDQYGPIALQNIGRIE